MELFLLEHKKLWRKRIVKICVLLCFIYTVIFGSILSFQWFGFGSSDDYTSAFGNNFDGYGMIRESQEYALTFGEELTDETLQQLVRDYQQLEAAGMEKELEKTDWRIINSWLGTLYPELRETGTYQTMISYVNTDKLTGFYERRQQAVEDFLENSGQVGAEKECLLHMEQDVEKSIIDRCVRKLYIDIARSKEKYIPVMSDFYDILMAQPEDEAKDIALSLELFVNGSLNIFNHQTNVDVDNRFTVYGIRDLGTELSPITMLVMMESIQNRIVENGKRGKATWLYIDEFHVLLNSEYSAKYLQQLWKKVRKQGGLCTGITQNVVDLLQNYTATTMLANSEFVALLKQANTDSSKMAEVIGVSEAQLRFVTNTASGMGLIKCGSVVIPFDNQISKDTDLYRLYNTNIHEKIAEQKKKEAMLQ